MDFFKGLEFIDFSCTLDREMKRLQQQGVGSVRRQAETLSEDEEDSLWAKGLLDDNNP